jgi:hypothetical protein
MCYDDSDSSDDEDSFINVNFVNCSQEEVFDDNSSFF